MQIKTESTFSKLLSFYKIAYCFYGTLQSQFCIVCSLLQKETKDIGLSVDFNLLIIFVNDEAAQKTISNRH